MTLATDCKRARAGKRRNGHAVAACFAVTAASLVLMAPAHAQTPPQGPPADPSNAAPAPPNAKTVSGTTAAPTMASLINKALPTSVLLFPALVTGADGTVVAATPATTQTQEIVTASLQSFLNKGGVGSVVYSNRLPSIERAVSEGATLKSDEAAKGPGDDPRDGQRFASIVGANEYLTVTVDGYKYDTASRRATFTLSVTRSEANGTPINTTGLNAVGEAPSDVAPSRQEASAVARASEVVAEQTVRALYPQSIVRLDPPQEKKVRRRSKLGWLIPAVAAGIALIIPR